MNTTHHNMNDTELFDLYLFDPETGKLVRAIRGLDLAHVQAQAEQFFLAADYRVRVVDAETGVVLTTLG